MENPVEGLKAIAGGTGYDDVFVFAPVKSVVEQGDSILGFDGCLNFFAGPDNPKFTAEMNFYNVHYAYTHVVGTSGGNNDDMKEALDIMGKGLDPAGLVTHIGGLDAVADTTNNLPNIPGGKKLIYTHIEMPLTPISDFENWVKKTYCLRTWLKSASVTKDCGALKRKPICWLITLQLVNNLQSK